MSCNNDWGQLKEIIVGTAKGYRIPDLNRSFKSCQFPEYDEKDIPVGPYPDWVIEETEEDLDKLAQTLFSHGIIVHRPNTKHSHPDNWHSLFSKGLYFDCRKYDHRNSIPYY